MDVDAPVEGREGIGDGRDTADTNRPLISVIVPIYNVEKYVRKCLESLKNQTMKQIEVICIDDGSTDSSGRIADEYESSDFPIFRVIHTDNRGLSAARNRGLDEARSPWLMFVDSDDWVDEKFCEIPYRAAVENQADMVIFQNHETTESGRIKRCKARSETVKPGLVNHETAVDIGDTLAWNKLYKKKLFIDIRYPEGRVYEDAAVTHKLIYKTDQIFCCREPIYNHRVRKGSISKSTSSRADEYRARLQRYEDLINLGYPKEKADLQLWSASLAYCGQASREDAPLYEKARETVDRIEGIPDGLDKKQKMMLLVWKANKRVYRAIYRLMGKQMQEA